MWRILSGFTYRRNNGEKVKMRTMRIRTAVTDIFEKNPNFYLVSHYLQFSHPYSFCFADQIMILEDKEGVDRHREIALAEYVS